MSKVYTKSGDSGETGLVGGKRVSKADHRIDLYGEVDELNSRLGYAISQLALEKKFDQEIDFLQTLQSALFDLGSNLACEAPDRKKFQLPALKSELIMTIEHKIDQMESALQPLKNFILPGGSVSVSAIHLCRTGARTVERKLISYITETQEEPPVLAKEFVNRLSDFLFVLARYVTKLQGGQEIPWKSHS